MAGTSLALAQRAVHAHFLRRLSTEKVPGSSQSFGDLTTAEVVQNFVMPATSAAKCSLAEALCSGRVGPKCELPWVLPGGTILDADGGVQKVFGPAKYFISHAWNCRFSALVELLEQHYAAVPATRGGQRVLPIYYWIDVLAVSQHFTGDFHDHPDSDFPAVIRTCKSVLFTMHPWRAPVAPTRVWCLFEVLTAIQSPGVQVEVLLDVKDTRDTRVKTLTIISNSIDVRTAQATVMSDKNYLLGCIEQGLGFAAFNNAIRKRLKEALLQAVTPNAVEMGDTAALHELLKVGGCVRPDGIADLASCFRFASEADMLNIMRTMQLRDLRPRGLVLSGKQRTKEVTLSDGGVRGWDGESFSLREYGELDTGRMQWAYLPAGPALCQAVGELLAPTVAEVNGTAASSSRGVEELWISVRPPRPDDNAFPTTPLLAAARGSPALSTAGSETATPRGPGSGVLADGSDPGGPLASNRSDVAGAPSLGPSSRPGSGLSPGGAPGSATAARAMARAAVTASPHRHRLQTSHSIGHSPTTPSRPSSGSGGVSPRLLYSPQTGTTGLTSTASLRGRSHMVLPVGGRPAGAVVAASASFKDYSTSSSQQQRERPALPALTLAGGGSGSPSPRVSCAGTGPAGAGMAGALPQPQPPAQAYSSNLTEALLLSDQLEVLQCGFWVILGKTLAQVAQSPFVKCTAPGAESSGAHSTARLTGELLALGLSASNLRQLHVRPSDPLYLDNLPACMATSSSDLRRISLTPVALGPAAIRQLARALSVLPELHSLTVGLDPAPFTTFMPPELSDREHWLAHEDKNEPDMALKRRRVMGLDEDGLSALVCQAWELKDDLTALPSAGRTPMATQQRAAGLGLCLALAAGWRDLGAYKRIYARWAWMRKSSVDEALADMSKGFEAYRELVADALQFVPESYAQRFNAARQANKARTRVQETYWELYASTPTAPAPPPE
eukprot:XP_001695446.1 predicted protein [Chlamydomonas reinhardtii]